MEYVWEEIGWYDCCSGCWSVVYNLIQTGQTVYEDIPLQVHDEDDIYTLTYMFENLSNGEGVIYDYPLMKSDLYYDIWSMVERLVTNCGVESVASLIESKIEIIRDESIDYNETWTCTDDWE